MRVPHSDYSGEGITVSYELNSGYIPKYDESIFSAHNATKEQLNLYIGIELFYGNYKEYLPRYLIQYDKTIGKLVTLKMKVDELPKAIERAIIKHGISAVQQVEEDYKKYSDEYNKVKDEVTANLPDLAEKTGLGEEDLLEILAPWLGAEAQKPT